MCISYYVYICSVYSQWFYKLAGFVFPNSLDQPTNLPSLSWCSLCANLDDCCSCVPAKFSESPMLWKLEELQLFKRPPHESSASPSLEAILEAFLRARAQLIGPTSRSTVWSNDYELDLSGPSSHTRSRKTGNWVTVDDFFTRKDIDCFSNLCIALEADDDKNLVPLAKFSLCGKPKTAEPPS